MSADVVFKELADHMFALMCAMEKSVHVARRDLSREPSSREMLEKADEYLASLKAGMAKVSTLSIDELSELIETANTTLLTLRKWMYLGYLAAAANPHAEM